MFLILINKEDIASVNIQNNLLKIQSIKTLNDVFIFDADRDFLSMSDDDIDSILKKINRNNIDFNDVVVIFASKHKSEKNIKSLTVHSTGVFSNSSIESEKPAYISRTDPIIQSLLLRNISELTKKNNICDFEVTFEVTHHTPILKYASIFIEIGSTKEEWSNESCGNIIANSISQTIIDYRDLIKCVETTDDTYIINYGIGIGGPHYAPNFTKCVLSDDLLYLGHVCPKYALEDLSYNVLAEMIKNTKPTNFSKLSKKILFHFFIMLDWKGLGAFKEKVTQFIEDAQKEFPNVINVIKIK